MAVLRRVPGPRGFWVTVSKGFSWQAYFRVGACTHPSSPARRTVMRDVMVLKRRPARLPPVWIATRARLVVMALALVAPPAAEAGEPGATGVVAPRELAASGALWAVRLLPESVEVTLLGSGTVATTPIPSEPAERSVALLAAGKGGPLAQATYGTVVLVPAPTVRFGDFTDWLDGWGSVLTDASVPIRLYAADGPFLRRPEHASGPGNLAAPVDSAALWVASDHVVLVPPGASPRAARKIPDIAGQVDSLAAEDAIRRARRSGTSAFLILAAADCAFSRVEVAIEALTAEQEGAGEVMFARLADE